MPQAITTRVCAVGWFAAVCMCGLGLPVSAGAQFRIAPSASWLIGGAGLTLAALPFDARLRTVAERNQSVGLDHMADLLDPLGRSRYMVPALALAYALPKLTHHDRVASAALRVGLSALAADAVMGALKPTIGRHRPDSTGRPFLFRPFSASDDWHSLPSGHTTHAFAMATAIADEARNPWVTGIAYGVATGVGLQRIYTQAHWTSDVVASATLATAVSLTTVRWLRHRHTASKEHPSS